MKLSAYLEREGLTGAEFARRSGLSEGTISLLCRGEIWLSRETARKIVEATSGDVTPNDFMNVESADGPEAAA